MSSCGEHLKEQTRKAMMRLTVEERILRALANGRCDLEIYAAASGLTVQEAGRRVRSRRAAERRATQGEDEP